MMKDISRPLRMLHDDYGYKKEDDLKTKSDCIRARLAELKEKGFGGVVTNVAHKNYLQDTEEFELMAEKVKACKELGMRMWLYDEDGWPSGSAMTLTVDANPLCQARACAMVVNILKPGEAMNLSLPKGHLRLLQAVAYLMDGDVPTDEELLSVCGRCCTLPVSFTNTTDQNMLCLSFFERYAFEGTQAQNNGYACRRYIDVTDPEAVGLFIENTYKPYTKYLRNYYAKCIGDTGEDAVIEAIFTDEPSFMGVYINDGLPLGDILHKPDTEMDLYPIVNWGRHVSSRFAQAYGYSIEDELTALFLGHSEHFCSVREDFYKLMSELYEDAYFKQLSEYCASVGLNFSGHLLLEDDITMHTMFEGNFFSLLRHMHIPGFDILNGIPETVLEQAFTPLLVCSIAELNNRAYIMDETSCHQQKGNVLPKQMYCSLMMQLALGADVFHSYYPECDDYEKKKCWDALTRAHDAIYGTRLSETLLYYPIETMMRHRKPYQHKIENNHGNYTGYREFNDTSPLITDACNKAMTEAQYAMLNSQHAFTFIDAKMAMEQPTGKWKNLVVGACEVGKELFDVMSKMLAEGCKVIWYHPREDTVFSDSTSSIPAGVITATTPEELMLVVRPEGACLVAIDGTTDGIIIRQTEKCVLLVNSTNERKNLLWKGAVRNMIDPYRNIELPIRRDGENTVFSLEAYNAVLLF